jgi:hypothetical protein
MRIFGWFLLWLLLAIAYATMTSGYCRNYYRLNKYGVATTGVAREQKPHEQLVYLFEVKKHTYKGLGRNDVGPPSFLHLWIGDTVPVYYLPEAPEVNCLGDPKQLYSDELSYVITGSLIFSSMIVAAIAFRLRHKPS